MSIFKHKDSGKDATKTTKKRLLKTPIALHFYSAFSVIIVFFFISFNYAFAKYYARDIDNESSKRIDSAINSTRVLSNAFANTLAPKDYDSSEDYLNELINLIIYSADVSNEKTNLVLFYEDETTDSAVDKYTVLWPTYNSYNNGYTVKTKEMYRNFKKIETEDSSDSISRTKEILKEIIEKNGIQTKKKENRKIMINGRTYMYRFATLKSESDDKVVDNYYILFYIDITSNTENVNKILFRITVIAIIIAGVLSIIISFPILESTRRLSKFANRIRKGDFDTYNGTIASRELNELRNTMNQMATKLKENDKEQKTFFQNASHELRTPLMSIQGYAEGMKYDIIDKNEGVDVIISESSRLSNMVENLLSISKMDLSASNNYEVKKQIVNVYELLGITIDKIRGSFLLTNKELINNISIKSNIHILANENDIFRMLENVFSNCLRYANKEVTFNCYSTAENVVFEISDDGPGISDEVMAHLFERFAKGSDGKHGIGLALVKSIAAEHNGTVEAGNKKEGGAIFKIKIPIIEPTEQLTHKNKNQ